MKKMLISGLLSSVLAVSAVWGEELDSDIKNYFDTIMGHSNAICADTKSKDCIEFLKEACQYSKEKKSCEEEMIKQNSGDGYIFQQSYLAISSFMGEQILRNQFNENKFVGVLQYAKSVGVDIDKILNIEVEDRDDSAANYIGSGDIKPLIAWLVSKNSIKETNIIQRIFGSIKNRKNYEKYFKDAKSLEIKNILYR